MEAKNKTCLSYIRMSETDSENSNSLSPAREATARVSLRLSDICIMIGYFFVKLAFSLDPSLRAREAAAILDDDRALTPEEEARLSS